MSEARAQSLYTVGEQGQVPPCVERGAIGVRKTSASFCTLLAILGFRLNNKVSYNNSKHIVIDY